ncbi:MAG: MFS transporter [Verrucomicrobia bacterium]|nr:MFS transporter [Verrucomicrobiota bacterium]
MSQTQPTVTTTGRYLVVTVAFLGWLCAGVQLGTLPIASLSISQDLLGAAYDVKAAGRWFSYYTAALSLGAAIGGIGLGWLGDRWGRTKAMAASIFCYSLFAGAGGFAQTQEQLAVLRFLTGLGIGGMWPNGVALVSEVWPDVSRPFLAGVMGAAFNLGMFLISQVGLAWQITSESWRWLLFISAVPSIVGMVALWVVPESPKWLALRGSAQGTTIAPMRELFSPPLLRVTLAGILLASIPLIAAWSAGRWLTPWADSVAGKTDPGYKASTQAWWAFGATVGSFLGGQIANWIGRRLAYFLFSLGSVVLTCGIFLFLKPQEPLFLPMVLVQGLVATLFFGWLPLCLPEMFPTRVRASGAGMSYNFGRFLVAVGVLLAGALTQFFGGDFAKAGAIMGIIYGLGMVVIWFAPDTTGKKLED